MSYSIEIMGENQSCCLGYFIMEISGESDIFLKMEQLLLLVLFDV